MEQRGCRVQATVLIAMLLCAMLTIPSAQANGPVDVQFVGVNSLTYSGADENAVLTSNTTVRQGDRLHLEIPVENIGASAQTASIMLEIRQATWNETVFFEGVSIDSMTTEVLIYLSSTDVIEGELEVEMSINGTSTEQNDSIHVGPPPLPNVHLDIELATENYLAGDLIQFNLTSTNANGERAFDGRLVCTFLGEEAFNDTLSVGIGQSVVRSLDIHARPGVLECLYVGDRNQTTPTPVPYSLEGLPSAIFDEAGSSGFSLIGGPWHEGDNLETSFILRNQGDAEGSATLEVVHQGTEYNSDSITLAAGAAGELQLDFEDLSAGDHTYNWSIVSTNGIVLENLAGSVSFTVLASQAMFVEVDVEQASTGLVLNWNASITNGVDRDVKLRYGYRLSGTDVYLNEQIVTLGSGTLTGQTTLGDVPGDTVLVRMEPVGWVASTNSYIATATFETTEAKYSLNIDPLTLPREPIQGQQVTVTVMLQNTASIEGPSGVLYLTDSTGLLLGEVSTDPLRASSSRNVDFVFTTPYVNEMLLTAEWRYDSFVVDDEQSVLVNEEVVEETSMDIPFVAIGGGIALAACVIFLLHLRRGTDDASSAEKTPAKKKTAPKPEKKNAEPVERSCPSCDRTLRIPGDYSGTVRCPDCSEKFEVEAEPSIDLDEELDSIDDEVIEEEPVEKKVEIACPQCSSKLRVPSSYKGSVRCPSCSIVFSAK